MKFIKKNNEPQAWRDYRETPGVVFAAIPELKLALLEEQGYLCCYCMSQINADKMKVEHYKPRKHTEYVMTYTNLFAACTGNFCSDSHCDTRKQDSELSIHPSDPKNNCESIISYSINGKLVYIEKYKKDIEITLNLNNYILVSNRQAAILAAAEMIRKNGYNQAFIKKQITAYSTKNGAKFYSYCNAVLWLLRRKLSAN